MFAWVTIHCSLCNPVSPCYIQWFRPTETPPLPHNVIYKLPLSVSVLAQDLIQVDTSRKRRAHRRAIYPRRPLCGATKPARDLSPASSVLHGTGSAADRAAADVRVATAAGRVGCSSRAVGALGGHW